MCEVYRPNHLLVISSCFSLYGGKFARLFCKNQNDQTATLSYLSVSQCNLLGFKLHPSVLAI